MSVRMRQQLNIASNWFIQKCHTLLALLHSLLPSLNSTVQTNLDLRPSSSQHELMLTSVSKQLSGKTDICLYIIHVKHLVQSPMLGQLAE